LPLPDGVLDPGLEAALLLVGGDLQPVLEEADPGLHDLTLEAGADLQEAAVLLLGAEAEDVLDAGPVVPAAVEDHDLAGCREVREIALDVHLALLAVRRGGQGDDPED